MRKVSTYVLNGTIFTAVLGLFGASAGPAAAEGARCERTIKAKVAVIDQPITLNRHGATIPGGMIYALLRDVVDEEGRSCADRGADCRPGKVHLRDDKRPRPMVLRMNVDDCLEVTFTNLLTPEPQCFDILGRKVSCSSADVVLEQVSTRAASLHVQGLNWAESDADDGAYVGENCNSIPQAGGGRTPGGCERCERDTAVYKLYAESEGTYYMYDNGDMWTPQPRCFPFKPGVVFQGGPETKTGGGDGGHLPSGLFGAVNVQPKGALYYRSQVTEQELCLASTDGVYDKATGKCRRRNPDRLPVINYQAVHPKTGIPVLSMLGTREIGAPGCEVNEIVHTDLTAVITGPLDDDVVVDGKAQPGAFKPALIRGTDVPEDPVFRQVYANPERQEPYREFTIIYHESFQVDQAFPYYYEQLGTVISASDAFGINYSMDGLSSPILANRLDVGPLRECVNCQYEEFFLSSWTAGDPGMVVDHPVNYCVTLEGVPLEPGQGACKTATKALYPDDPSNVYHSYMSDHLKFRVMHAGPDLHHLHHQHAHQWLATPNSPNGDYLDSQSIGPGSSFTMEMVYNGSGNVNQTVGDSIFHCHFYPHFASGMWGLWRVHDSFEPGTKLDAGGVVARNTRALPDAEIVRGTPIPALVPMPTLPMAPMPSAVRLTDGGKLFEACTDGSYGRCVGTLDAGEAPPNLANPGYPFFIPGIAGSRAPHPPGDFAWAFKSCDDHRFDGTVCSPKVLGQPNRQHMKGDPPGCVCAEELDGGLRRNVFLASSMSTEEPETFTLLGNFVDNWLKYANLPDKGLTPEQKTKKSEALIHLQFANMDYRKDIDRAEAQLLPEGGTALELVGMRANATRFHDSRKPDGSPAAGHDGFILNGLPPAPGAPYADPCIQFRAGGGPAAGLPFPLFPTPTLPEYLDDPRNGVTDRYLGVDLQIDAIFNKEGWHFPQQRVITLWGDAFATLRGERPPEPLFMRVNSYDCMEYVMANLVPRIYELDDFQVRTPTDVLGQHIHLVKFDVTSSDGSANGWNYEDGTFAPNEVTERIEAINESGGLFTYDGRKPFGPQKKLAAKPMKFFGAGPVEGDTSWVGAQATIQRWYDDPLLNNYGLCTADGALIKKGDAGGYRCTSAFLPTACEVPGAEVGCDRSGGICSNSTAPSCATGDVANCPNVCTAADLSNCKDAYGNVPPNATCIPAHDRTIRSVFTHDHFSPSTHQQAGLYAGLIVEPKGSVWYDNQTGERLGGWNEKTNRNFPGRRAEENHTFEWDGGPTSWQAVIEAPAVQQEWTGGSENGGTATYREFLFQLQDSTLQYQAFNRTTFSSEVKVCANELSLVCQDDADCPVCQPGEPHCWRACRPASVCSGEPARVCTSDPDCAWKDEEGQMADLGPCQTLGVCSNTGICSNRPTGPPCLVGPPGLPRSMQAKLDEQFCGPDGGTCRFVIDGGIRSCTSDNKDGCASSRVFKNAYGEPERPYEGVESCNFVPGIPATTWSAGRVIDGGGGVEVITFKNATASFSYNYRNEPLYARFNCAEEPQDKDMALIYSSTVARDLINYDDLCPVYNEDFAPCRFCSDNGEWCSPDDLSNCGPGAFCSPYRPLTPGVEPGDPFTPLMRAYPGDDIQIRTLVGAHINPHNLTLHDMNWPMEPSFVDSGWRNSQVMGISEHFELLTKVPAAGSQSTEHNWSDYLFKPGAAALEQSAGSWGLLRAYNEPQEEKGKPTLLPLSTNPGPEFAQADACPGSVDRTYDVVALPVSTVLPQGTLVYNQRLHIQDPEAMLFFNLEDPKLKDCTAPDFESCWYDGEPTPLVLRAAAGECVAVTLYNGIPADICDDHTVPEFCRGVAFTPRPNNAKFGGSQTSIQVGLHPQLVSYDVRTSDGSNVGFNPTQTVPPQEKGEAASSKTYTWYAGHYDPDAEGDARYIPIEFGSANLTPPDPLNHYGKGLIGGLIVEPPGSSWVWEGDQTRARVSYDYEAGGKRFRGYFREFVVFQQDDLARALVNIGRHRQAITGPGGRRPINAINYKSEYLRNGVQRYCTEAECNAAQLTVFDSPEDVSCMLSVNAWCPNQENGGGCKRCDDLFPGFPETPVFEACAGEEVRFRLLHPGGTNTNETFELFGHTFSEAPYMTAGNACFPNTQTVNLGASQFIGTENLCGLDDWLFEPHLNKKGAELTLNEWKASRMGQGPTNHFDAVIEKAGGAREIPGDYLYRSYSVDHFNLGMWGIFRVKPKDQCERGY